MQLINCQLALFSLFAHWPDLGCESSHILYLLVKLTIFANLVKSVESYNFDLVLLINQYKMGIINLIYNDELLNFFCLLKIFFSI